MKKILIAIPTNKYIEPETYKSIYDLTVPEGYEFDFQFFFGYQIDQIRNLIAHWAIRYDYLFSVDSDISFEKDTLVKMLKHNVDIVSGLYIQRIPGTHSLEIYEASNTGGCKRISWEKIKDIPFLEIVACGMGCALIKSKVLVDVGYPYYTYHSALDHNNTLSEDVDFCRKAKQKGFKIFADTTIHCKHTGNSTFVVGQIMGNRDIFSKEATSSRVSNWSKTGGLYKSMTITEKNTRFDDSTSKMVKRVYPGIDPETGKYSLEVSEGSKFTGDSIEYTSLAEAVERLKNPIGASIEIGVRLGLGSKTIIDAYRHYHPNVKLNHLGIDPYGNIDYATSDMNNSEGVFKRKFNYDNLMKKTTLINFAEEYPEFHLVNLEDTEFMQSFDKGYPVYDEHKKLITKYEMIHFDGPHDTKSVLKEVSFFNLRKADQTVWVFDDISGLNFDALSNVLSLMKFDLISKGSNKAIFEYIA